MKWRRQLRGFVRATVHVGLAIAAIMMTWRASTVVGRAGGGLLVLATSVLLLRAAFIYIPGFDPLLRVPWRGPRRPRRMAITFDDGPNGAVTEAVLALLAAAGARATFFMIGQNVEAEPELARRVAAAGHAVGSHTYSHAKLDRIPFAEAVREIERGHEALARAGVAAQALFRAPHGLKTFALVRHLTRRGLRPIAWTAGVFDTDCPSGAVIARRARRWIRPGAILLLHDGKRGHERGPLLEALPRILQQARAAGLDMVTVPELLA